MDLPHPARQQVVAIKQRYGLTDAECRWLRRSGQFRVTRDSAGQGRAGVSRKLHALRQARSSLQDQLNSIVLVQDETTV